jgi:hypothetical protein
MQCFTEDFVTEYCPRVNPSLVRCLMCRERSPYCFLTVRYMSLNVLSTRIRFWLAIVRPSYIPVVLIDVLLRTPTFPAAIFPTQIIDIIYLLPRVQSEVEVLAFTPVLRSPLGVCLVDRYFLTHSDTPQTYQGIQVYGLSNGGMHPMCEL